MRLLEQITILLILLAPVPAEGRDAGSIYVATDRDVYVSGDYLFFSSVLPDDPAGTAAGRSQYAYLLIRNEDSRPVVTIRFRLNDECSAGAVYLPDTLGTGYYQLVAFTNFMRNLGENHYFTRQLIIVNRFDRELSNLRFLGDRDSVPVPVAGGNRRSPIELDAGKTEYGCRERVELMLDRTDEAAGPDRFSLSVSLKGTGIPSLNSGMDDHADPGSRTGAGSRDNRVKYLPETEGIYYYGRVAGEDGQPVPGKRVYLSIPDSIPNLVYAVSGGDGTFSFLLSEFYFGKEAFFMLEDPEGSRLIIDDKFSLENEFVPQRITLDRDEKELINLSQDIVKVQKAFPSEPDRAADTTGYPYSPLVYPAAQTVIFPDEYLSLPDFYEISREILPGVRIRRKETGNSIFLRNALDDYFFRDPPGIFLDGVPVPSIDPVMRLGSNDISRIEYIGKDRFVGDIHYPGIIAVFTREQIVNNLPGSPSFIKINIPANYPHTGVFEGSRFMTAEDRGSTRPDFRQLLYWNAMLSFAGTTSMRVEFYTSDVEGSYEIVCQGISDDGRYFRFVKEITINSVKP